MEDSSYLDFLKSDFDNKSDLGEDVSTKSSQNQDEDPTFLGDKHPTFLGDKDLAFLEQNL